MEKFLQKFPYLQNGLEHDCIVSLGRNSGKTIFSEAYMIALITKYQIKDILDFMRLSGCTLTETKLLLEKWSAADVDLPTVNTLIKLENIKLPNYEKAI